MKKIPKQILFLQDIANLRVCRPNSLRCMRNFVILKQRCVKYVIVDILLLPNQLMGLMMFIIGCLIKFGSDTIEEFFADRISGTWSVMRSAGSDANMDNFDLGEYIATIAFLLIGVGGFFLFVSFFGCCGGIGKIRCFLIFVSLNFYT